MAKIPPGESENNVYMIKIIQKNVSRRKKETEKRGGKYRGKKDISKPSKKGKVDEYEDRKRNCDLYLGSGIWTHETWIQFLIATNFLSDFKEVKFSLGTTTLTMKSNQLYNKIILRIWNEATAFQNRHRSLATYGPL